MVREYNKEGRIITNDTECNSSPQCRFLSTNSASLNYGWQVWDYLTIDASLPWQKVFLFLSTSDETYTLSVRLTNWLDEDNNNKCDDLDTNNTCDIAGSSLFDNIDIKPALRASDDEVITRECRLYPRSDSLSCKYTLDGRVYNGWNGYCLTRDIGNPQNCLQWWPVDLLAGETLDEISSGYQDRTPLYYCIKSEEIQKDLSFRIGEKDDGDFLSNIFSQLGSIVLGDFGAGFLSGGSGSKIEYQQLEVSEADSIFFREPNVAEFCPTCVSLGMDGTALAGYFITGTMRPNAAFVGGAGVSFNIVGGTPGVIFFMPSTQPGLLATALESLLERLTAVINSFDGLAGNPQFGGEDGGLVNNLISSISCNSHQDSRWGGWGYIIPTFLAGKLPLSIGLPVGWPVASNMVTGTLTQIPLGSLLEVSGGSFVGFNAHGMRVITDQDSSLAKKFTDPNPDIAGDIIGVTYITGGGSLDLFSYQQLKTKMTVRHCTEVVQVVTPSGKNKAWNSRVVPGSSFTLENNNPDTIGESCSGILSTLIDFFNVDLEGIINQEQNEESQIDINVSAEMAEVGANVWEDKISYGADYQPFGSIVAPADSIDNPLFWDSRQQVGRDSTNDGKQPLYYEAPRTVNYSPPYQARFGLAHDKEDIKQLFAQSYGYWQWEWTGGDITRSGCL